MLADMSIVHLWSSHAKALFGTLTMLLHEGRDTSVKVQTSESNIFCFKLFVEGASNVFKGDELGREIAIIAFPALVALAADPLASLVDTAFIGQLGSVELAAVGVSIAVFNLISKLLNFPVLNLTTSLVAEEDATDSKNVCEVELENGLSRSSNHEEKNAFISVEGVLAIASISQNVGLAVRHELSGVPASAYVCTPAPAIICLVKWGATCNLAVLFTDDSQTSVDEIITNKVISSMKESSGTGQKSLPAVSTALVVGSILGFFELSVLTLASGTILDLMGVTKSSNMRIPAEQYLGLRALGSPAVVLSLVVQGVFRGFKDTQTPLLATAFGNIVNMILVPILMFKFGYGVSGSAVATVISQYLIALILLMKLCRKVVLFSPRLGGLQFGPFIKNGSLLLARSAAVMLSLTLATSEAARQGAIPMAAHQICMQVWLATSLLSDAIALAGQAIIAGALAKGNFELAKSAAFRILQIGFVFGIVLAVILGVGLSTFSKLFTSDHAVLRFLGLGIPFVAATQPVNSLAFVFDGLHFGASDFFYAAYSMIIVAILASGFMIVAAPMWGFVGVWLGLTVLMTLRMLTGFLRVGTASGPWKFLKGL